jgi:hypothetical protein
MPKKRTTVKVEAPSVDIPLKDVIIPMFGPVLQDILNHSHTHYVFEGGRGSTKSSLISIAIPLIMLSNPNYRIKKEDSERRLAVIRATYENARRQGDENVYLISGENFYAESDPFACTVDNVHPNDCGCYHMAKEIRKTLEPIFNAVCTK